MKKLVVSPVEILEISQQEKNTVHISDQ